jgi:hypothetical protein
MSHRYANCCVGSREFNQRTIVRGHVDRVSCAVYMKGERVPTVLLGKMRNSGDWKRNFLHAQYT